MNPKKVETICFSPSDVASYLGIGKTLAYELFHAKGFPSFCIPGTRKRLVRKVELDRWIHERELST